MSKQTCNPEEFELNGLRRITTSGKSIAQDFGVNVNPLHAQQGTTGTGGQWTYCKGYTGAPGFQSLSTLTGQIYCQGL